MYIPSLYLKTPIVEEKIKQDENFYIVNTRIEIVVYKTNKDDYCAVISKDIMFENFTESILLKYIKDIKYYDEILDLIDDFMEDEVD